MRRPGGGFCLSREARDISVADIIRAVDEPIDATRCDGKLDCQDGERCMTHQLWDNLNVVINDRMASVSLARLVARQVARTANVHPLEASPRRRGRLSAEG